jgi:hypothetical protein
LGSYRVKAHRRGLHTLLVGWGVPRVDALRHKVVEVVVGDLVELMINDPVTIARVTALLAAQIWRWPPGRQRHDVVTFFR